MPYSQDGVYRIRLSGPWGVTAGAGDGELGELTRIKAPCSWREAFGEFRGTVCLRRDFHSPPNLRPETRVAIRFPKGAGEIRNCRLNGRPLLRSDFETDDVSAGETYEITEALQAFNTLELDLTFYPDESSAPGGLWEPAVIEIHEV